MYFRVIVKLHLVKKMGYHPVTWICFPPGSEQCSLAHTLKISIFLQGHLDGVLHCSGPVCPIVWRFLLEILASLFNAFAARILVLTKHSTYFSALPRPLTKVKST